MTTSTSYTATLTSEQISQLHHLLEEKSWSFDPLPYAHWRAKQGNTTVVAYQSGKLTVQGRGTADFVQFLLEPEVLHEARFGYEAELAQLESPDMFLPHAGIDESGKGDYFGPLVIACVHTEASSAEVLLKAGVTDSKSIKSDTKIAGLARLIRQTCPEQYSVVAIGPESYNRLYDSFGNLNRLLAWGHAKSLENLLQKVPSCPKAISDQFAASKATVEKALGQLGRTIQLEQHPKAEADIAVAAASILARDEFVRRLELLGKTVGRTLPKGAGPMVLECAKALMAQGGVDLLRTIAKLHFKTTQDAAIQ